MRHHVGGQCYHDRYAGGGGLIWLVITLPTGGFYSQRMVTMYNITGDSWELPGLNIGRWNHGCSWYDRGEERVGTG